VFLNLNEQKLLSDNIEQRGRREVLLDLVYKVKVEFRDRIIPEETLLEFLESKMNVEKFNSTPHIINEYGRSFKLCGREDSLKTAAAAFRNILNYKGDREDLRIPLCSGLSGLGKTRMLEEWESIMDIAKISGPRLGVLIPYYNGHMPQPLENHLSIESSFSWRLLHRLFIEDNGPNLFKWFETCLPEYAGSLSLPKALEVIRLHLIQRGDLDRNDVLNLFLGIDEYQNVNALFDGSPLQELLAILGNTLASPGEGLKVFPMLAGTYLSSVSIANSSRVDTIRVPMNLLSAEEIESAISSIQGGLNILGYAPVMRHLFYFEGLARWTFRYVGSILQQMEDLKENDVLEPKKIEACFSAIKQEYLHSWVRKVRSDHELSDKDLIYLAAHSLSGMKINSLLSFNDKLTWSRLQDSSVCLICDEKVTLPYPLYYFIADFDETKFDDLAMKSIITTLRSLIDKVDSLIYDKPLWELWERFGAHFHALRINSLLLLGNSEVRVSQIFEGALLNDCNHVVRLKPMLVMETEEVFSENIGVEVGTRGFPNHTKNWVDDGWIVINGERGKGVDLFFCLERVDSPGIVVITDQRKRIPGYFGMKRIKAIVNKAKIVPKFHENVSMIACIFSCFSQTDLKFNQIPSESCLVSYNQSKDYHGSSPCININQAPISHIKTLFSGQDSTLLCDMLLQERNKRRKFKSLSEFQDFVKSNKLVVHFRKDFADRAVFQ
jgi:hypothetical protein